MVDRDSSAPTQELNDSPGARTEPSIRPTSVTSPLLIGRYRIEGVLGQGGFGIVYLARDEQLERRVAVKVPHPGTISRPSIASSYLREAQTVAGLDHPSIVPVYDVGSTDEYPCFIVSKYIRGKTLSARIRESRLNVHGAADLVAKIAEALHYAHQQGLIHRDVKPGNILLDSDEQPWLVDFGLALREDAPHEGKRFAGTAAYMSPEQARGEGHRIDSRSDVFSLGIVLFELLTGQRPFSGETNAEIKAQIIEDEIPSPTSLEPTLPRELDRICRRAVARRARDRFESAEEFAVVLRQYLADRNQSSEPPQPAEGDAGETAGLSARSTHPTLQTQSGGGSQTLSDFATPIRIVPKGLRAFDEQDAAFFLELVPGPRDRFGLPDLIRFWKHRITQRIPGKTFSVGLLYGPSGCGKSSLVKAGVLPELPTDVRVAYIEATASETESRLRTQLHHLTAHFELDLGLKETLSAIRRGHGLAENEKLLIVIDQFEQWLQENPQSDGTELVEALRQCDGTRIQCLLLVRDEFWLAVSRFMQELEIPLEEGLNCVLVDLFDQRHARKVLTAFGIAHGQLPDSNLRHDAEFQEFVHRAVEELSVDDRVICVRLALFAEMMKDKPWTPASLKGVGGSSGVGERYLDETFCSVSSPARYRQHEPAIRNVLRCLLSSTGSELKGHSQSHQQLLRQSGYAENPERFEDLLRVLDGDLRLITPIESDQIESESGTPHSDLFYQLTHDYLVNPIRGWLTRKQRETIQGRAELKLEERAALWNRRPEARQLPSFKEFLTIRLFTQTQRWSAGERKLMASAGRHHLVEKLCWITIALAVGFVAWQGFRTYRSQSDQVNEIVKRQKAREKADELIGQLQSSDLENVPDIILNLRTLAPWSQERVREAYDAERDPREKRLLSYTLLGIDDDFSPNAINHLPDIRPDELPLFIQLAEDSADHLAPLLWESLDSPNQSPWTVVATASVLAKVSPEDPRWRELVNRVSGCIAELELPYGFLGHFGKRTSDFAGPLDAIFLNPSSADNHRRRSAIALASVLPPEEQVNRGMPDLFIQWILESSDRKEVSILLDALQPHSFGVMSTMRGILESRDSDAPMERRARAAAVMLCLGGSDSVLPLLGDGADVNMRSLLIKQLGALNQSVPVLAKLLEDEEDGAIRQAIVLAIGYGIPGQQTGEREIQETLARHFETDPDSGVHAAAEWALRRWGSERSISQFLAAQAKNIDPDPVKSRSKLRRNWFINSVSQTMVRIGHPVSFRVDDPQDRRSARTETLDYELAISSHEVTLKEFLQFRPRHEQERDHGEGLHCPVHNVTWYDAAAFCNWLSEREGLTPCYVPAGEGSDQPFAEGMRLPEDILERDGYRLPTALELECFIRAATETAYCFGDSERLLKDAAWYEDNSKNRTWPVGLKLPNRWGGFDVHGNLWEWTNDPVAPDSSVAGETVRDNHLRWLLGGAFDNNASRVRAGNRLKHYPYEFKFSYGFRTVRTLVHRPGVPDETTLPR